MLPSLLLLTVTTLVEPGRLQNITAHLAEKPSHHKYSSLYVVEIAFGVDQTTTLDRTEISTRLNDVVSDALEKRAVTHLQQDVPVFSAKQNTNNLQVLTEIVSEEKQERKRKISFVVFVNTKLVLAEVILSDLALLSFTHISARLQFPVVSIGALAAVEESGSSRWWLIALIVGSGALILLCGWMLLVIYFNTCNVSPTRYDQKLYATKSPNITGHESQEKSVVGAPEPIQVPAAFCTEKRSVVTKSKLSESNNRKVEDKISTPNIVVVGAENARTPEIYVGNNSGRWQLEEKLDKVSESGELEEERSSNYSISECPTNDDDEVVFPESGTPTQELDAESIGREQQRSDKRLLRPKSATPHRPLRTPEGDIIETLEPTHQLWNPYKAGDKVAQIYLIGPTLRSHPSPAPPSANGIVIMRDPGIGNTESPQSQPFQIL
ncbi:hypothetical protein L596_003619 [Steinernema carpocapsae]|uniref:SEA domain-containing protein n=1 Tax=Steinernema carpocapsae TaxID=34508 RepID=A0A4U8UWD2_STECR|nr:hypothetical protein L596_003619 [Steinernema carpocapsae]